MEKTFDLSGKVIVITGGAGFLGRKHAEAVAKFGASPVLLDIDSHVANIAETISDKYNIKTKGLVVDITEENQINAACIDTIEAFDKIDGLINNAANNPAVCKKDGLENSNRLENFELATWNSDLAVGLTGAFLCAKHFGFMISENPNGGTIINISSDLGIIAPDQRLYHDDRFSNDDQPVKPITYSVVKTGIIGLTRYLATYWAEKKVRCNALCPGGVYNDQDVHFVEKVNARIPLGRLATADEYEGAIVFMCSDSSSYMNGSILTMDGGRSVW